MCGASNVAQTIPTRISKEPPLLGSTVTLLSARYEDALGTKCGRALNGCFPIPPPRSGRAGNHSRQVIRSSAVDAMEEIQTTDRSAIVRPVRDARLFIVEIYAKAFFPQHVHLKDATKISCHWQLGLPMYRPNSTGVDVKKPIGLPSACAAVIATEKLAVGKPRLKRLTPWTSVITKG